MQDRSQSPTPPEPESRPRARRVKPRSGDELFADFVSAGELERRRVAESIHDDSIQVIAAMGMRLQMLRRAIDDPEQVGMLSRTPSSAVQLSIARLRHLVYELHPPGLEQEGLAVALALALDSSRRDSRGRARARRPARPRGPRIPQSAILFRIAQEALANVREHARATTVTVTLLERDGGHAVRIADDGCGFEAARRAARGDRLRVRRACGRGCASAAAACASSPPPEPGRRSRRGCRAGMPTRTAARHEPQAHQRADRRGGSRTLALPSRSSCAAEPTLELADVVSDAAHAILVSMRDKPAVAVLDVHIPGGGTTAARGIKRCSPKTRVLALSAGDDRETVLQMLEAGADGYLVKGSSAETILTSIERAARGQGSLSVEVTGGVIEELAGLLHARSRSEERSRRREERVRHALDDDVVHAVYQPICTLAGSTVGAEAARALPRAARPRSGALVRRGRRGGAAARPGAGGRARGAERAAGAAGARLPRDQRLARDALHAGVPAADRGQRRGAPRGRDHRARAHRRLRRAARGTRRPARVRRAHRDRRRRRGLREPPPHPPARARVHQARPHADRRHRVATARGRRSLRA